VIEVLVDEIDEQAGRPVMIGRGGHQAPEVDGSTTLVDADGIGIGDLVRATVVGTEGIDLFARPMEILPRWSGS
jgi:hypothetical protein